MVNLDFPIFPEETNNRFVIWRVKQFRRFPRQTYYHDIFVIMNVKKYFKSLQDSKMPYARLRPGM